MYESRDQANIFTRTSIPHGSRTLLAETSLNEDETIFFKIAGPQDPTAKPTTHRQAGLPAPGLAD